MIGSEKYVKFSGTCSKCGLNFDNAEDARKHEDLFQIGHIVNVKESFDLSTYLNDLKQRCKSGIKRLK